MIKINNYWYSYEEIKEALEERGYTVITLEVSTEARDYPKYETYALKNGEEPNVLNTLQSIAIKEYHKKPKLNGDARPVTLNVEISNKIIVQAPECPVLRDKINKKFEKTILSDV